MDRILDKIKAEAALNKKRVQRHKAEVILKYLDVKHPKRKKMEMILKQLKTEITALEIRTAELVLDEFCHA